jgi:hypothetical protein
MRAQFMVPIAVTAAVGGSALISAGVAQASSPALKCPAASSIDKAAGTTLNRTESESADGYLVCGYSTGKYGNVVVGGGKVKGFSAADFAEVVKLHSKKTPLKKLSGLGSIAYEFTQNDAKNNADGIATTGVFTIVGDEEFDVIGTIPAKNVIAIAKVIVG